MSDDDLGPCGLVLSDDEGDESLGSRGVAASEPDGGRSASASDTDADGAAILAGPVVQASRQSLQVWLRPVGVVQQQLARCLADTQSRSSSSVSLVSRFFRRAFDLATPRLATGVAAEADSLRTNRQTLIGLTQEVAATVYQCAAMSTNTVLQRLMTAIQTGSRPLVAFTSLCFDETPVWLRVGETGQASSSEVQAAIKRTLEKRRKSAAAPMPRGGTSKPKVVARIFQVDAQCAFLMRH